MLKMSGDESRASKKAIEAQAGFSLLETIVALVILAMALSTIFEAYGDGMRGILVGNRSNEARMLAQSILAGVPEPATPGTSNGSRAGIAWQLTVKPATGDLAASDPKSKWRLMEVETIVRWAPNHRIVLRSLRMGGTK